MALSPMSAAALGLLAILAGVWLAYLHLAATRPQELPTWAEQRRRHLAWLTANAAAAATHQAIPLLEQVANTGRWDDLPRELTVHSAERTDVAFALADHYRSTLPNKLPHARQ